MERPPKTPVSVQKVKRIIIKKKRCNLEGYRLMDIKIIEEMISSLCCPCCFEKDLAAEGFIRVTVVRFSYSSKNLYRNKN